MPLTVLVREGEKDNIREFFGIWVSSFLFRSRTELKVSHHGNAVGAVGRAFLTSSWVPAVVEVREGCHLNCRRVSNLSRLKRRYEYINHEIEVRW